MTRSVQLTKEKIALVDDADFEKLNSCKWRVNAEGYAIRDEKIAPRKRKTVFMHREILCPPEGSETDHRDRNKLNNQRSNLRVCTGAENKRNKAAQKNNTSGYKGVTFNKEKKKWKAQIALNNKCIFLGYFIAPEEAARAYDAAAANLFGAFAKLNTT